MKDFDEARDLRASAERTFRIGGETFTLKAAIRPGTLDAYRAMSEDTPDPEALRIVDDAIIQMIADADAETRWNALRAADLAGNPLNIGDMMELTSWMIETVSGRPLASTPSSQNGSPTVPTGIESTEPFVSPAGGAF
jgi:hypothetical protein